jgi:putative nucleotidyltransferase with HDIG domain
VALGDHRALGEAAKHRGIISRRQGRLADSERHLASAYASAIQREDLLLAAETAREQAELYELEGRSRDTLQALVLSHGLFTRLRAQRELLGLQRNVARLETRFYAVVRTWAETIESKDPYTRGHCDRVSELACGLAREMGFDEITMFWFRMGALLHDVGKIVVPTEVLNKNGPLTPEERELIERHPEAGVDLLRDIEFPWDILPMIRGHHERWDGRGYPDRLAGEAIPRSARVLCVADVYDALTTDRPYRAGYSPERALEIMAGDAGKMFDPEMFEAFVGMLARQREAVISQAVLPSAPSVAAPKLA